MTNMEKTAKWIMDISDELFDKLYNLCWELRVEHNEVAKEELEAICEENGVEFKWVYAWFK